MQENVFAPPLAAVADAPAGLPDAPKPRSVLLLQAVLALLVIFLGLALILTIAGLTQRPVQNWAFNVGYCGVLGVLVAAVVFTLKAAGRRRPTGRWLGLLWIASLFAIEAIRGARGVAAGLASDDAPETIAQALAALVPLLILGLWIYRYEFSARARAWFFAAPTP